MTDHRVFEFKGKHYICGPLERDEFGARRRIGSAAEFAPAWPEWCPPRGTPVTIEHDGFSGKVIGWYETLEGKPGVNLQLDNARVVHVYGMKWIDAKEGK